MPSGNQRIYFRTAYNGECGECRYIYSVNYDGQNLVRIIPANGGDALALDLKEQKMYFSDFPGHATIRRARLDGSKSEFVFEVPAPYDFCRSIALHTASKMMYLNLYNQSNGWKERAIAKMSMDGTGYQVLYQVTGEEAAMSGGMDLFLP